MRIPLPRTGGGRLILAVVALAAVLNLAAVVVDAVAPSPSGRPSSSFATTRDGFAAWAELARRHDREVHALRSAFTAEAVAAGGTAIVLDAPDLPEVEARRLRRFAQAGGRVVAGGRDPDAWLETLTGDAEIAWSDDGSPRASALPRAPETGGAKRLRTAAQGSWSDPGSARVAVRGSAGPLLLVLRVGRGRLILLADSSPLQNRLLASDDNAALALGLAGRAPVTFLEGVHGYGRTGLAALPANAKAALLLALLSALVLMLARGRRFGPAEGARGELPPPRHAYVRALAATLARGRRPTAIEPVRQAALERLGGDAAAAAAHGLPEAEAAALAAPARNHEDAVLVARAFARLQPQTTGAPPPTDRKVPR